MYADSNDKISRDELKMAFSIADQARKNAEFAALPRSQQRVQIAKDVLKWLSTGRITAKSGVYLGEVVRGGVVTKNYAEDSKACTACALGSLFAVTASRDVELLDNVVNHFSAMSEGLSPYFDQLQLSMIESAFEKCNMMSNDTSMTVIDAAVHFCPDRMLAKDRMSMIMRNIIRNKGEFIP